MALGSGMAAQVGWATETTWGVPVTPTVFNPFVDESIKQDRDRLESDAIIAGRRLLTSGQWSVGNYTVSGDVTMELMNRGLLKAMLLMFGTVVDAGSGPDSFTHTFTPGDLTGDSVTLQVGKPSSNGTVNPYAVSGAKITGFDWENDVGKIARLKLSYVGRKEIRVRTVSDGATTSGSPTVTSATAAFVQDDVGSPISGTNIPASSFIGVVNSATSIGLSSTALTNTPVNASGTGSAQTWTIGMALATASYLSSQFPMTFIGGAISLAGSSVKCKKFKLSGDLALAPDDRRFIGSPYIDEPLEAGLRTYDGTMDLEYTSQAQYDRFIAGTEHALLASWTLGLHSVAGTLNVRLDGETPVVKDRGILTNTVPFKAVASGADSTGITVVVTNSDATT